MLFIKKTQRTLIKRVDSNKAHNEEISWKNELKQYLYEKK